MNMLMPMACAAASLMGCPSAEPVASGSAAREAAGVKQVSYLKEMDIVDTAAAAGNFKTLAAALQAAGWAEALKGEGPFTVFAPTDEAFAKLPKGTLEMLLKPENKAKLAGILTYHVVPGAAMAKDVASKPQWTTVNGQRIDIAQKDGKWMVDGAAIIMTDVKCSNGVIHAIDSVIMPASDDVIAAAASTGMFKTLLAAIDAAGLTATLKGEGPFTVFAPTDEAFAKLPEGTVENLLKPENKGKLADVLKYHVVAGRVYADQVMGMTSGKSLLGQSFMVKSAGGRVMIDNATVTKADIETSNGVVHVIDTVLMPK